MQVASIVPTPLLDVAPIDYNMCLYQIVKTNSVYAHYFANLRKLGKFVIMDNGAAEGVNPSIEEIVEVLPLVQPSEIILPDKVYDKEVTLQSTKEAYLYLLRQGIIDNQQLMAVPQGKTFDEWLSCAKEMMQQDHITTIGISKFVTPKYQCEMGKDANVRLECVAAILNIAEGLRRDIQIHLLGCWSNPKEIGEINKAFPGKVRGTDSAIAYVYARAGVIYDGVKERPDNKEIDFHYGTADKQLLLQNIYNWEITCTTR